MMATYLRLCWFLIPDGLRFPQLFFSCSLQLLRFLSGLFDMQATEQNANSKTKYYLEIKQINSTRMVLAEMFLKMQHLHLHPCIARRCYFNTNLIVFSLMNLKCFFFYTVSSFK